VVPTNAKHQMKHCYEQKMANRLLSIGQCYQCRLRPTISARYELRGMYYNRIIRGHCLALAHTHQLLTYVGGRRVRWQRASTHQENTLSVSKNNDKLKYVSTRRPCRSTYQGRVVDFEETGVNRLGPDVQYGVWPTNALSPVIERMRIRRLLFQRKSNKSIRFARLVVDPRAEHQITAIDWHGGHATSSVPKYLVVFG